MLHYATLHCTTLRYTLHNTPQAKLWQSIDAHSGYDLPFPLSPWSAIKYMDCAPAHDFHHSHNHGNCE